MDFSNHHAFVIEGDKQSILSEIKNILALEAGIAFEQIPDIFQFHNDSFLVRHTSEIKETFNMPTGPPALPWVLKWLMLGISIPSK